MREKAKVGGAQRAGEVGRALNELRDDNNIRVIVITGKEDVFTIPPSSYGHHGNPGSDWDIMTGVTRAVEIMCTIEKPVIAKVNGHAVGFGANLVLGCDFIIAVEEKQARCVEINAQAPPEIWLRAGQTLLSPTTCALWSRSARSRDAASSSHRSMA